MKMPWESDEFSKWREGKKTSKIKSRGRGTAERSCRLDLRLTAAEKNKLLKKAAAGRRTVTSVIAELIEGMR